jgi:hypothetical protein
MLIFLQLTLTEIYGLARCYIFSKQFSVEYIETVNGSNAIGRISRSDFDQGHRVLSNSSVKFKFDNMKNYNWTFYEGAQGSPFSYVYNDRGNLLQDI